MRHLNVTIQSWPLKQKFNISRGSKKTANVIHVSISDDGTIGQGECVPYGRYGETLESVVTQIEDMRDAIQAGIPSSRLAELLAPGAARNAIDCALWDLESKLDKISPWQRAKQNPTKPLVSAFTISLDKPEKMAKEAHEARKYPLLKLKLGGADGLDGDRIKQIRRALPGTRLIVDANEGWSDNKIGELLDICQKSNVELVEQPLPSDEDHILSDIHHSVPICADESVHTGQDLSRLKNRYDWVNIKLDKTGGLTEGLKVIEEAKSLNFSIMVGCMVGTSLAMAPALILASQANIIDLDGPLWLAKDHTDGIIYKNGEILTPRTDIWGFIQNKPIPN